MMDSEINYSKLTTSELKILISANDMGALEEFNRRIKSGEIIPKVYSTDEAGEIVSRYLQLQVNSGTIDYKNLTDRELRHLMGSDNPTADKEYDRRIESGEIKRKKVAFEDIKKTSGLDKAS